MTSRVDPFIGTGATDLPPRTGLAATWWWPKPQVGNTHPGATHPLGMVSACAYSGAYPTGYGRFDLGTEGLPVPLVDTLRAAGSPEVPADEVGLAILEPLKELDVVAYLRFASVYRAFESVDDFEAEIEMLRFDRERSPKPQPSG